jgi:hypothetical protein
MIKMFCDGCGKELHAKDNVVSNRIKIVDAKALKRGVKIGVEILAGVGDYDSPVTWNSGQLCKSCVAQIILDHIGIEKKANKSDGRSG